MHEAEMSEFPHGIKPPPRGIDLPYDDGEPMESDRHELQAHLLKVTLRDAWKDRDDFYVAGNMFIYFSELQAKKNDFRGPDVFLVVGTSSHERKSWVVWEEDGRMPDLVIELLSPSTERVDRGEKMRIYAQVLRVAEYYLFDPFSTRLDAYELDSATRSYVKRSPDAEGRYPSRVTGFSLGVVRGSYAGVDAEWLRWLRADGSALPSGVERADEEARRADEEARRADREAQRAEEALARVAELEARLRAR